MTESILGIILMDNSSMLIFIDISLSKQNSVLLNPEP